MKSYVNVMTLGFHMRSQFISPLFFIFFFLILFRTYEYCITIDDENIKTLRIEIYVL